MDILRLKRRRLAVYSTVCGFAVATGFGAGSGLMTGGILSGLAIALVSAEPHRASRVASLGVAGGLGMALSEVLFGGSFFWGLAASPGLDQGVARLAVRGAICGGVSGGVLGMALSRVRYRWLDALWLGPALAVWILLGGLRTGLPQAHGASTGTVAVALAVFLLWLYTVKQDGPALMAAGCGVVGFGVGLPLACGVGGWIAPADAVGDAWQLARVMWGCIGGAALGLAARVLDEDGCRPRPVAWQWPTYAGVALIGWSAPVRNGWSACSILTAPTGPLPEGTPQAFLAAAVVLLCVAPLAASRIRLTMSSRRVAALLLLWVILTTIGWRAVVVAQAAGIAGMSVPPFLLAVACGGVVTACAVAAVWRTRSG